MSLCKKPQHLPFGINQSNNGVFKQNYTNVPIELIKYAHMHKMHRALGLYLLMKASCDGHMVLTVDRISALMASLNIKDGRSFTKHLHKLIEENWIGYDIKGQVYYIRGSRELRKRYGFRNSSAVVFNLVEDAPNVKAFVHGGIICHEVKRRNTARKGRIKKLAGSSALKKESAIQELAANGKISEYIGLSLSVIGKLLGVSQSQADRIKVRLQCLGYISTKARFKVVHVSDQPDFSLIKFLPCNRRYSVKKKIKNNNVVYEFKERIYDEILSSMDFRNQKSIVKRMGIWER
jgi:hypothetical protein